MAITLDANTNYSVSSGTSVTQSITVANDANFLVVQVSMFDFGTGNPSVSTLTYNGTGLTKAVSINAGTDICSEIWYLYAPSTGTHDVVITANHSNNGIHGSIVSLKGVKQSGQPDATTSSNSAFCSDPVTINITNLSASTWIFDSAIRDSGTLGLPGGNPGFPQNLQYRGASTGDIGTSYVIDSPMGVNSLYWNFTGCTNACWTAASFIPDPVSSAAQDFGNAPLAWTKG